MNRTDVRERTPRPSAPRTSIPAALWLIAGIVLGGADALDAQQLSVEGRGGLTAPYGDLSGTSNASQGFSAQGALHIGFTPQLGAYLGGSYHSFVCNLVTCGGDLNSRGVEAGLRYNLPGSGNMVPWIRGGVMVHRAFWSAPIPRVGDPAAEVGPTPDLTLQSDWSPGSELGVGADFQIRPGSAFGISVRHYRYSTEFVRTARPPLERTFGYFLADVGFRQVIRGR